MKFAQNVPSTRLLTLKTYLKKNFHNWQLTERAHKAEVQTRA